jgi:uncharacterized protein (DUF1778 family)
MSAKPESGGARMIRTGRKPILLGPTEAEKEILDRAAAIDGRKTTPFVLHHALVAAKKILAKGKSEPETR